MGEPVLLQARYRSRLEHKVADQLEKAGVRFTYETLKVEFLIPERRARYTPDFICGPVILEAKGYFREAEDRQRLVLVKQQRPELDIRIVFQNARKPIYKGSKTTYADWADKNGFQWSDKGLIPPAWISEMKTAAGAEHDARSHVTSDTKCTSRSVSPRKAQVDKPARSPRVLRDAASRRSHPRAA